MGPVAVLSEETLTSIQLGCTPDASERILANLFKSKFSFVAP